MFFFAKLVFDHGDLLAVGLGQYALEQGGLPEPKKPVRMVTGMSAMGISFQMN